MNRDLAEEFERDGIIVVDEFFPRELMADCYRELRRDNGSKFSWTPVVSPLFESDMVTCLPLLEELEPPLSAVHKHDAFKQVTRAILGEDFADLYLLLMTFAAGGRGGAWHQDCEPGEGKPFGVNRLAYCQDVTAETGGELVVVPGSHRQGKVPVGVPHEPLAGEWTVPISTGTLVIMHCALFHRITAIRGDGPRYSINFRAGPRGTTGAVTDVAVYRNVQSRFSTNEIEARV